MADEETLLARHRRVLPNWLALYYEHPIALVDGEGRRVRDSEGREYLDFFGGILTTMTGHNVPGGGGGDPPRRPERILHTSTLYLIPQQVELAERIASLVPIPDAQVFFTTSGTEANDTALLLATTYRRSNQVLAMRNSYHGRSFSAVSVTGNRAWSASSLAPFQVTYLHGAYKLRSPFSRLTDAELHRGLRRRPREGAGHRRLGRRGLPDRRAHPGGGRQHHPARRHVRGPEGGPRPPRHPVHLRRGADRLGPHRRALLGLPGPRDRPRHDHLRQGHRQRPAPRRGGRPAPRS